MSPSAEPRTARVIATVGAIMLIDSLWGGIAVLRFDWLRLRRKLLFDSLPAWLGR
jgi:hypothetical protein